LETALPESEIMDGAIATVTGHKQWHVKGKQADGGG
jgi:hypothetical protein